MLTPPPGSYMRWVPVVWDMFHCVAISNAIEKCIVDTILSVDVFDKVVCGLTLSSKPSPP